MKSEKTLPKNGHYIEVNGINMYYEDHGKGETLILLHGGIGTSRILGWENQINFFSKHYRVIIPDCRGYGRTNNPEGKLSYNLMMHDIISLIEKLDLKTPLICGWSDGAQIALEFGMHHPYLVKAIVVGGALITISEEYIEGMKHIGISKPGVVDIDKFVEELPDLAEKLSEIHSFVYGKGYWKEMLKIVSKMWLNPNEFPGEKIKTVLAPTLLILGDRDEFISIEENLRMFQLIPNAELAILPNSTHDVCEKKFRHF